VTDVLVLGSINADLVMRTPVLPAAGETVRATSVETHPGGKGANQAVAACRMGASVELVGRVGRDAAGAELVATLAAAGVGTSQVAVDEHARTGTALITVADDGANTIVTSGGANHRIGATELAAFEQLLPTSKVVCIQLEVPMDVVDRAVAAARAARVPVILDPAPVAPVPGTVYDHLAWITPNAHEAAALTGHADPRRAATELRARGVTHAVVTLGADGAYYAGPDEEIEVAAPVVEAVDTVACGDAFDGALAASLASGLRVGEALRWACAAGAAAARTAGVFVSLPDRGAVEALLDREDS
jgi:ribokinase